MANYHSDEWILSKLQGHYNEALNYFSEDRIVGIFLQGSQNYGLDVAGSDIDTKLIITPTFEEIAFNKKPISTTHIRANEEHIDFKDIRLYMQTFRKQNLNFLEILFTPYKIVNPLYEKEWNRLIAFRENIARANMFRGVKSMKGTAMEKYHALKHPYPSKVETLEKYGYDLKQAHHLFRIEEYLVRYIKGDSYIDCLSPKSADFLLEVKEGKFDLDWIENKTKQSINHVIDIADKFCQENQDVFDPKVDALLNDVQLEIMRLSMKGEF